MLEALYLAPLAIVVQLKFVYFPFSFLGGGVILVHREFAVRFILICENRKVRLDLKERIVYRIGLSAILI